MLVKEQRYKSTKIQNAREAKPAFGKLGEGGQELTASPDQRVRKAVRPQEKRAGPTASGRGSDLAVPSTSQGRTADGVEQRVS